MMYLILYNLLSIFFNVPRTIWEFIKSVGEEANTPEVAGRKREEEEHDSHDDDNNEDPPRLGMPPDGLVIRD